MVHLISAVLEHIVVSSVPIAHGDVPTEQGKHVEPPVIFMNDPGKQAKQESGSTELVNGFT